MKMFAKEKLADKTSARGLRCLARLRGDVKAYRAVPLIAATLFLFNAQAYASVAMSAIEAPDWSTDFIVASGGRSNPYNFSPDKLTVAIRNGRLHALNYPVTVTGILLPYRPIDRALRADNKNLFFRLMEKAVNRVSRIRNIGELQTWLGLHEFPSAEGEGPFFVPFKNGERPTDRMGFTLMQTPNGTGFTISCAQCHTANLFGRKIVGLTNRFPRANLFFDLGLKMAPHMSPRLFQLSTGADKGETEMYRASRVSMAFTAAKAPAQLGLDTSLAQVALSLAKRAQDEWATRVPGQPKRPEKLSKFVADSKPAVWWNLKYKNRWLSDGSVVSGNPIFTNILWNEIGRGSDLKRLDQWLSENSQIVAELTTAAFSAEAPRWTDFFSPETIPLEQAKHGQALFNEACAKCHGTYDKAWELPGAEHLSLKEQLATLRVTYKPRKPVVDVGTDPQRFQGMKSLEQLNNLEISKRNGIRIEAQQGYVPPPLVGIWARWPYFHNNSAPTLCAVLSRATDRPKTYWAREANDPETDFDSQCNGYPRTKPANAKQKFFYDTKREGLSNSGHDERIFIRDGQEIFSASDKLDLIKFLQTL